MEIYLRNTSVFTPDSGTQKCAAHNRNFLTCTGEAEIRLELASKQGTYDLVTAVLCNACNVILLTDSLFMTGVMLYTASQIWDMTSVSPDFRYT